MERTTEDADHLLTPGLYSLPTDTDLKNSGCKRHTLTGLPAGNLKMGLGRVINPAHEDLSLDLSNKKTSV